MFWCFSKHCTKRTKGVNVTANLYTLAPLTEFFFLLQKCHWYLATKGYTITSKYIHSEPIIFFTNDLLNQMS